MPIPNLQLLQRLNRNFIPILLVVLCLAFNTFSQTYPKKIRGYKVHEIDIKLSSADTVLSPKSDESSVIRLSLPTIVDVGPTGVTFEVSAEVDAVGQSGRVDILTFSDLKINGIAVTVAEVTEKFTFKSRETIELKPVRVFINTFNLARAARSELLDTKKRWLATGTVFVFGKFKKFGIGFKRVVPIKLDLTFPNPLRT